MNIDVLYSLRADLRMKARQADGDERCHALNVAADMVTLAITAEVGAGRADLLDHLFIRSVKAKPMNDDDRKLIDAWRDIATRTDSGLPVGLCFGRNELARLFAAFDRALADTPTLVESGWADCATHECLTSAGRVICDEGENPTWFTPPGPCDLRPTHPTTMVPLSLALQTVTLILAALGQASPTLRAAAEEIAAQVHPLLLPAWMSADDAPARGMQRPGGAS